MCKLECLAQRGAYGDRYIAIEGYKVGRMVDGKHCGCAVAWLLENGNCPCAPNDSSNPIAIEREEPR